MATNYPGNLDAYATLVDNVDDVLAAHANDRGDAIEAIEAKVGIDSSAVSTAIDYFLKHASGAYRTHTHDGTSDDGPNIPIANVTGAQNISILTGTVAHGGTIPLPDGYTAGQCKWTVGLGILTRWGGGSDLAWTETITVDANRVVTCQRIGWSSAYGTANYIIIGIK